MLKKWSKAALCAVTALMVAAFALTVFAACSNGSDEDEDGKKDLSTTTVVTLPTSVGTDPFTTGTYTASTTHSDDWIIVLCEGNDQAVSGTKFEIDTAKHSVKFLYNNSKNDGKETADALMKYSYDSTKKEIYLALSKLGYKEKGDDDTGYLLWTKDEIVSYLQSIVGQTFYEKDEPYVYSQEKFEEKRKEIVDMFEVTVTYGYEKSDDGIITLNLKEPIIKEGYDTSVTLTPSVPKLL